MSKPKRQTQITTQSTPSGTRTWKERLPALMYIAGFLFILILFYALYSNQYFADWIVEPYVRAQTWVASKLLNLCGFNTVADGTQLSGALATINVVKGCDGMEVTALYLIGVMMVPFDWKYKWRGIGYGLAVLVLLNLVRIIGLYLSQIYWQKAFEFLHLHGGFALFMVVAIFIWTSWANWALRKEKQDLHAAN